MIVCKNGAEFVTSFNVLEIWKVLKNLVSALIVFKQFLFVLQLFILF